MKSEEFYSPEKGVLTRMSGEDRSRLLGDVVSLLMVSPIHRGYLINDIGAMFLPPLHLNQFRIYRSEKRPIGLITWAWLTEETARAYVGNSHNLRPEDWNAGTELWFIDFLAPFGHMKQIAADMKHTVFPDQVAKAIRVGPDGKFRGIRKHHGVNWRKAASGSDEERRATGKS